MRPGMYIGKLGDGSSADDGIYILLKEVLDNSVDEFVKPPVNGRTSRYTAEATPIPPDEIAIEYLLNTLRTRRGFSPAHFEARTGTAFSAIAKRVEYLRSQGLLCDTPFVNGWITTTERGFRYLNNVLEEFI